jgi:hypothetical protein
VTVTVCGAQAMVVRTTLRFTVRTAYRFLGAAFTLLLLWTTAGRALSATWTAPPPMIAPPQVQAHNLANAIRTDIGSTLVLFTPRPPSACAGRWTGGNCLCAETQKKRLIAMPLTLNLPLKSREILSFAQGIWLTSRYGTR